MLSATASTQQDSTSTGDMRIEAVRGWGVRRGAFFSTNDCFSAILQKKIIRLHFKVTLKNGTPPGKDYGGTWHRLAKNRVSWETKKPRFLQPVLTAHSSEP